MTNNVKVKANIDELDKLIKSLKDAEKYRVRIGILGDKAAETHKNSSLTNAQLGAIHEQPENDGTKIPKRSFLEMPLKEKLGDEIKNLKKDIFKSLFIKNNPRQFYIQLKIKALEIVKNAFATNGYGQWAPLTSRYEQTQISKVKGKKKREQYWLNHNILTDTGQLRRSISGKVIKND